MLGWSTGASSATSWSTVAILPVMAVQTPKRPSLFPTLASGSHLGRPTLPRVTPAMVVAHQGGWDEALVVALPIAAFALILWLANRRAARLQEERDRPPPSD